MFFLWGLLVIVLFWCWITFCQQTRRKRNLPHGPVSVPFIGNTVFTFLIGDVVSNFAWLANKYGSMFSLTNNGQHLVVVNDLEIIERIHKNDKFVARSSSVDDGLRKLGMLGAGIIGNNDLVKWKHNRGLVLGAVNNSELVEHAERSLTILLGSLCSQELNEFARTSQACTLKPLLERVMVDLLCRTLFDLNSGQGQEVSEPLAKWIDEFMGAFTFYTFCPSFLWPLLNKTVEKYDKIIKEFFDFEYQFIDKKKREFEDFKEKEDDKRKDLLWKIFSEEQKDSSHPSLSRNDIRAIMNDVILGGTDTTANTTSIAVYHISRNMQLQDRLFDELQKHLAENNSEFSYKTLSKLPLLDAVVQETMRIFHPVPLLVRMAVEDVELEGYKLESGDGIAMNLYSAYHNPKHWTSPEVFNPDRFLTGQAPKVHHFGVGKRTCPGQNLGTMYTKLILATLFARYVIKPVNAGLRLKGKFQMVTSIEAQCTAVFLERRI